MAADPILECLRTAGRYNGRVFGSYVRDVIIRRELEPGAPIEYRPIDLWFDDAHKMDQFRAVMSSSLELEGEAVPESLTPALSWRYLLYHHKIPILDVTLTLSERLPVNDFDISFLTCHFTENGHLTESHGPDSVLYLMGQINQRKCRLLYEFAQSLQAGSLAYREYHDRRIYRNYTLQGWRIQIRLPEIDLHLKTPTVSGLALIQALNPIFELMPTLSSSASV
jgi:hypothetical protein